MFTRAKQFLRIQKVVKSESFLYENLKIVESKEADQ